MTPRLNAFPAGAIPTTEPRAGGQAPVAAAGLGEAAGLAAGDAAGGLAAGAATGAAGEAGATGLGNSPGLAGTVGGDVGATAVDGAQAASTRPVQASSSERRDMPDIMLP